MFATGGMGGLETNHLLRISWQCETSSFLRPKSCLVCGTREVTRDSREENMKDPAENASERVNTLLDRVS